MLKKNKSPFPCPYCGKEYKNRKNWETYHQNRCDKRPVEAHRERLNYFQRRSSTHATIVVAVVFGLFSLLNLIFNMTKQLSFSWAEFRLRVDNVGDLAIPLMITLYFCFVAFGIYEIDRWRFFQEEARNIAHTHYDVEKEEIWKSERVRKLVDWCFRHAQIIFLLFMISALTVLLLAF